LRVWRLILGLQLAALVGGLAVLAWTLVAPAAAIRPPPARYLVLFQTEPAGPGTRFYGLLTANLLGRFGRAELQDLAGYRPGESARYAATFVLPAYGGAPAPPALLADVRRARRPVVWVQHGAAQLFADPDYARVVGWRVSPPRPADYLSVVYKGQAFTRDRRAAAQVAEAEVLDPTRVQPLAWAVAPDGRRTPWALRAGALTYVLEAPFAYATEDDRYVAFAGLLFDILAPDAPERHRAMVRIEDVGPEADPQRIRALADLLAGEGVPFSLAVYDGYRDPLGHFTHGRPLAFELHDRPALVSALRYAVWRGGVLVAHGHTHQFGRTPNPYAAVSGGDYEFIAARLQPGGGFGVAGLLPGDSVPMWRDRLAAAERGWRAAGLEPPDIFTTPHYAASPSAYQAFKARFAARYERVTYFPKAAIFGPYDQFFPFETVDQRGDVILPEDLGYLARGQRGPGFGRSSQALIATARRDLVVRDGFASFFFHWYEDPRELMATVRGLRALGYRFVSPRAVLRDTELAPFAPQPR